MRVAVVGGGGFRAPMVWESVAGVADEAGVDEVVLHDVDPGRLTRTAAVVRALRAERGGGPPVVTTTALEEAVDGAGYVFCAIRVGGLAGRIVDESVPLELGVLGQETVGPGGIAFALRTIPVMERIAGAVARRSPAAWFLNFTNPAGLVTEALADTLGDRVVGVCDSPTALCARVAAALERPMPALSFGYAGLNHLGWLAQVIDGDHDLLPGLLADDRILVRVEEARILGLDRVRRLGMIPNEYLAYLDLRGAIVDRMRAGGSRGRVLADQQATFFGGAAGSQRGAFRSDAEALAAWRRATDMRHGTYMAEVPGAAHSGPHQEGAAAPEATSEGPGDAGYAAIAAAFLRAISAGTTERLILDVRNGSSMAFLDDRAVVEVTCEVGPDGVHPLPAPRLPANERELVTRMKAVERTTIRAAREGSAALALEALRAHPAVPSREVAERILDGYLDGHAELRELLR